jgi:hypothetical protein
MRWSLGRKSKQRYDSYVIPLISQVTEDTVLNGLIAIYYGERVVEVDGSYLQEITLVFKDEHLCKHGYLDKIYRLIRRIIYGRIVDIETFYVHVACDKADYCLFPKIYSGTNGIQADNIHLDTKTPYPQRLITKWVNNTTGGLMCEEDFSYLFPCIYVNTSNHAMATHDANPHLHKTLYQPNPKKRVWQRHNSDLKINFLTRSQVDKKYNKNR